MRIAIVDDLAKERASLHLQLGQILNLRSVCAEILEYESGEAFLAAEKEQRFTAAFLDIYMGGMSGMDAARELRKMDTDCMLVFTTTSTDHALEGFQVRAMHYLVKPFSAEELETAEGEFTPSPFVKKITGIDNVCERSAVLAGGRLIKKKKAADGVTVALAAADWRAVF